MERPALHLRLGAPTGALEGKPLREKPIVALKSAQLGSYAKLRSTRKRQGAGWEGLVLLTASDWEPGNPFKTPLGKIFGVGTENAGFAEIFQILLLPQGNRKPLGPPYDLSPNRTDTVMSPFSAILHGRYDQAGRPAGVLQIYPYARQDWQFIASPDVTDYWNYGWTTPAEINRMDSQAEFFDDDLRKHLSLALTHWLKWDELPVQIVDGKKAFGSVPA